MESKAWHLVIAGPNDDIQKHLSKNIDQAKLTPSALNIAMPEANAVYLCWSSRMQNANDTEWSVPAVITATAGTIRGDVIFESFTWYPEQGITAPDEPPISQRSCTRAPCGRTFNVRTGGRHGMMVYRLYFAPCEAYQKRAFYEKMCDYVANDIPLPRMLLKYTGERNKSLRGGRGLVSITASQRIVEQAIARTKRAGQSLLNYAASVFPEIDAEIDADDRVPTKRPTLMTQFEIVPSSWRYVSNSEVRNVFPNPYGCYWFAAFKYMADGVTMNQKLPLKKIKLLLDYESVRNSRFLFIGVMLVDLESTATIASKVIKGEINTEKSTDPHVFDASVPLSLECPDIEKKKERLFTFSRPRVLALVVRFLHSDFVDSTDRRRREASWQIMRKTSGLLHFAI